MSVLVVVISKRSPSKWSQPRRRSERQSLIGPQRPVGELLERRALRALDELLLADAAGVQASSAAADLPTVQAARCRTAGR